MEDKKLLIAGIDPGITTGFAVLDIEGNVIKLSSSKQFDLNLLVSESIKLGKVVLVGTDKSKIPNLVYSFATKLGAKVINPEEDLKVNEKKRMIEWFDAHDEHQGDALASALFAYKSVKALIDKIDFFAKQNNKQNIKNKIKELVITKRMSIKSAASLIEKKDEPEQVIEKVVTERKLEESDFLRLYGRMKSLEYELQLVRNQNAKLKNTAKIMENKIQREAKTDNFQTRADFREKSIRFLENLSKSKDIEIQNLKSALEKFNELISNINEFYVLKKLDTLGMQEFNFKNKILNIRKNDILLVDNPNIVSNEVIGKIKNNIFVIVHKKPLSAKIANSLPFVFINAKNLSINEDKYFGFVYKKNFEIEKDKSGWVNKVINDYRHEKELILG